MLDFMTTKQNETARSGKTETLEQVLERIQRMYIPNYTVLMGEDWDWLVVLQCMQDHGLFKTNPQRPPLSAFVRWMHAHGVKEELAHCSMRKMSYANNMINGARYPWTDVTWEPYVLQRWRILYDKLSHLLYEMEAHTTTNGMN